MLASDKQCQDCGQHVWQVGLAAQQGTLHLCIDCAREALVNRDTKNAKNGRVYASLLKRVFDGAAS